MPHGSSRVDKPLYIELLASIAQMNENSSGMQLVSCPAIQGVEAAKAPANRVMIIGRSVNGWNYGWKTGWKTGWDSGRENKWTPADISTPGGKKEVVDIVFSATNCKTACPLHWVVENWGTKNKQFYNAKRSAFWRVIERTVKGLGVPPKDAPDWSSHLIWSNLYKVAPACGGNPRATLKRIQQEACECILKAELDQWRPRQILFLSGLSWARPFVDTMDWHLKETDKNEFVEARGTIDGGASVVVAPHPQTRKEKDLVDAILDTFRHLGSS